MLIFSPSQNGRKVNNHPEILHWVNSLEFALQIATRPTPEAAPRADRFICNSWPWIPRHHCSPLPHLVCCQGAGGEGFPEGVGLPARARGPHVIKPPCRGPLHLGLFCGGVLPRVTSPRLPRALWPELKLSSLCPNFLPSQLLQISVPSFPSSPHPPHGVLLPIPP